MLDSGPGDETEVLGCQSPHMRLTNVATPEDARTAPPTATTYPAPHANHQEINPCPLTTHPPYEHRVVARLRLVAFAIARLARSGA